MKDKCPLVSISCITFNHAPYIRHCLDGFMMQQTNFSFEVLIHDDASTDGTTEIIKEYEAKYPDIIKPLYEEENQWVKGRRGSAVFNFPRAKGKYIAMCEGDDYWIDPYKLQKQVDFLETHHQYSIIGHNAIIFERANNHYKLFNPILKEHSFSISYLLEQDWFIPTASILFRKSTLLQKDFSRAFLNYDYYLQLILLSNEEKLYYSNQVMSVYQIHEKGISSKLLPQLLINELNKLLDFINKYTEYQYDVIIQKRKIRMNNYLKESIKKEKYYNSLRYKLKQTISNIFHKLL